MFCDKCGAEIKVGQTFCTNCGAQVNASGNDNVQNDSFNNASNNTYYDNAQNNTYNGAPKGMPYQNTYVEQKSRVAAGLLGIFLGGFGVHNFYLGKTTRAIIQLIVTIVGILLSVVVVCAFACAAMGIWGLIEGILILSGSAGYTVDGRGVPLRD